MSVAQNTPSFSMSAPVPKLKIVTPLFNASRFTLMCWGYHTGGTSDAYSDMFGITDLNDVVGMTLHTVSTAKVFSMGDLNSDVDGTTTIPDNTWNHYCITLEPTASGTRAIGYLNGVQQMTGSLIAPVTPTFAALFNSRASDSDPGAVWIGSLCAYKIWNEVALTPEEIRREMWCYMAVRTSNLWACSPMVNVDQRTHNYAGVTNQDWATQSIYFTQGGDPPGVTWENTLIRRAYVFPPPLPAAAAAWTFNEGSGTTATDSSGGGRTATLVGGAWSSGGHLGAALTNAGVSRAADFTSLSLGTVHSVSVWVKPATPGGIIIGGAPGDYGLYVDVAGGTLYYSAGTGNFVSVARTDLDDGSWHHLVVTRNGTAVKFYDNGVQLGTTQTLGANTALTVNTLGGNSSGGSALYNGAIDILNVYTVTLSAEFANQLFELGALQAYWALNENTGTALADSSGNGQTATMQASGAWTTGKFGAAGLSNLTGSGRAASFSALNLGRDYTVAAWINGWDGSNDGIIIGGASGYYALYIDSTDLYHSVGSGNFSQKAHGGSLTSGWHHLALTRSGQTVRFYKDGVSLGAGGTITSVDFTASAIGGYADDSFAFVANMDDVRLYNVALSATSIAALYALTPALVAAGFSYDVAITAAITVGVTEACAVSMSPSMTAAMTAALTAPGSARTGLSTLTMPSTVAVAMVGNQAYQAAVTCALLAVYADTATESVDASVTQAITAALSADTNKSFLDALVMAITASETVNGGTGISSALLVAASATLGATAAVAVTMQEILAAGVNFAVLPPTLTASPSLTLPVLPGFDVTVSLNVGAALALLNTAAANFGGNILGGPQSYDEVISAALTAAISVTASSNSAARVDVNVSPSIASLVNMSVASGFTAGVLPSLDAYVYKTMEASMTQVVHAAIAASLEGATYDDAVAFAASTGMSPAATMRMLLVQTYHTTLALLPYLRDFFSRFQSDTYLVPPHLRLVTVPPAVLRSAAVRFDSRLTIVRAEIPRVLTH